MNNKKTQMSFWGIGPIFAVFNVILMVPALVLSFVYSQYFRFSAWPLPFYLIGAVLIIFGLYLWVVAGVQVDECILKGVLATEGVYGIVRNPIYAGSLYVIIGIGFALRSWLLLATIPFSYLVLKLLLRREDGVLNDTFGETYLEYKRQVNAFFPKLDSFYKAFLYPVETQEITNNFYAIKNKDVNCYIYKTDNQYICFDTGYGDAEVLQGLSKLNIDPVAITRVFLTHSDYDHASGIYFFPQATLYFGKNEAPLINGQKGRFGRLYNNPKITRDYSLLEDQQIITIDNTTVKTIYTPGHTCGHVIYQVDEQIIISGDAVIFQNGFIKPFYRILNMDNKKAIESTKIITEFEGKYLICTAHTGIVAKDN